MYPRLTLDDFVPADAAVLCEVDADPEHRRRFDSPADFIPSPGHAAAVIARWADGRRAGSLLPFAVRDAASGELVGGCELRPVDGETARISYWTHPRHRGRGVASEAVRQCCARAFADHGFVRVELEADLDNTASRRVAVRNGFRAVGVVDGRARYVLDAP